MTNPIIVDAEEVLKVLEDVGGVAGFFYPAIVPFLPLIPAVLNALVIVQQATGGTSDSTINDVINTLTPGKPNAPSLTDENPSDFPFNSR
jgi:hypothetical protein